MEAFYQETLSAYEFTAARTGYIEISAAQPALIDVAYIGQAEVVSNRLVELRDQVAEYNGQIAWYRAFQDEIYASPFLAHLPDDLRMISITDLDAVRQQAEEMLEE